MILLKCFFILKVFFSALLPTWNEIKKVITSDSKIAISQCFFWTNERIKHQKMLFIRSVNLIYKLSYLFSFFFLSTSVWLLTISLCITTSFFFVILLSTIQQTTYCKEVFCSLCFVTIDLLYKSVSIVLYYETSHCHL